VGPYFQPAEAQPSVLVLLSPEQSGDGGTLLQGGWEGGLESQEESLRTLLEDWVRISRRCPASKT
jgi:hypothetical protein